MALLISLSGISDNKHHASDVLAGAALGISVQTFNAIHIMKLFGNVEVIGSFGRESRLLSPGRYGGPLRKLYLTLDNPCTHKPLDKA